MRFRSAIVDLTLSALGQLDGYVEVGLRYETSPRAGSCDEAGWQVQVDNLGEDPMDIIVLG